MARLISTKIHRSALHFKQCAPHAMFSIIQPEPAARPMAATQQRQGKLPSLYFIPDSIL